MRRIALAGILGCLGCTVPGDLLDGLACDEAGQCAAGYECDRARDLCVRPDELDAGPGSGDADPDAPVDAGVDTGPVRDPLLGPCIRTPADTFDTGEIDGEVWSVTADPGAAVTVEGGVLVSRIAPESPSAYGFLTSRELFDFDECAVVYEVVSVVGDADAFVGIRIDGTQSIISFGIDEGEISAYIGDDHTGGEDVVVTTGVYDATEHRWLAIREIGDELVWLTSADGIAWREFARATPTYALEGFELIFGTGGNRATTEHAARIDNVNTPPL